MDTKRLTGSQGKVNHEEDILKKGLIRITCTHSDGHMLSLMR